MNATEAEKQIREAVEDLVGQGMLTFTMDLIGEIYNRLVVSVSLDKPYKSSYSLKKTEDWEKFESDLSELAKAVNDWPPRWRECAVDSFVREIMRRD